MSGSREMRLEFPDHVEAVLRGLAAKRGVGPEEIVIEALDAYLQSPVERSDDASR